MIHLTPYSEITPGGAQGPDRMLGDQLHVCKGGILPAVLSLQPQLLPSFLDLNFSTVGIKHSQML